MVAAPAAAIAQAAPDSPAAPSASFRGLWTGWGAANADSLKVEREGIAVVREDYATAGSATRNQLENRGRALGERVGEIVRLGDCAEGERVAREAGDFALVAAVRDYCRAVSAR
jgi:hypothetical protein